LIAIATQVSDPRRTQNSALTIRIQDLRRSGVAYINNTAPTTNVIHGDKIMTDAVKLPRNNRFHSIHIETFFGKSRALSAR